MVANDFGEMLTGLVGSSVELLLLEAVGRESAEQSKPDVCVGDDGGVYGGSECGVDAGENVGVKSVKLTRVSMTSVMIQNWGVPEHLDVLTRFVDGAIGNLTHLAKERNRVASSPAGMHSHTNILTSRPPSTTSLPSLSSLGTPQVRGVSRCVC